MIRFQEAHVKSLPSVRLGDLVDLRILQNWLSECDSNHGETCRILTKVKRKGLIVNLILIDVVRQKLVPMSSKCRYFTLSYMWGGVKMLQATNENLSRLMQDGGISSYGSLIPPVIYDAIDLIRALGERWLWVDSLCIVSDDYTQKHDQISQMGLIYTQAFATIAVLSGSDASARLPGFHRGTRTAQITETVRGVQLITRGATLLDTLMVSHYDDRGWTMQERILSRRCLFFSDFQVFFQCQKSIRHEIDESSSIPRQTFHDLHSLDLISEPPHSWIFGFEFYATLVESYTRRNLSYASDVLNAFEGLSSIMEQCCGSSFYYGLPESLFDIVVLWAPCSSIHFDRRRMYRPSRANEDLRRGITVTEFPSWSWAGWIGEVEYN
ncbi:HET-domain-containing protein, partial [Patellaria atrata CBS 101060]